MWDLVLQLLNWLKETLLWIPYQLFDTFADGVVTVIVTIFSICTACQLKTLTFSLSALGGSIPGVIWFLSMFKFGTGLASAACAYLIRFTIRRLPFIG